MWIGFFPVVFVYLAFFSANDAQSSQLSITNMSYKCESFTSPDINWIYTSLRLISLKAIVQILEVVHSSCEANHQYLWSAQQMLWLENLNDIETFSNFEFYHKPLSNSVRSTFQPFIPLFLCFIRLGIGSFCWDCWYSSSGGAFRQSRTSKVPFLCWLVSMDDDIHWCETVNPFAINMLLLYSIKDLTFQNQGNWNCCTAGDVKIKFGTRLAHLVMWLWIIIFCKNSKIVWQCTGCMSSRLHQELQIMPFVDSLICLFI